MGNDHLTLYLMKITRLISVVFFLIAAVAMGQESKKHKTAKDFFPENRARVLVVGTFHFDYPGLDAHQTGEEDKIDVLREPRKAEVTELVEYIKKFRPNKIAIEAMPNWRATEKLRKYKQGEYRGERDERFQLAMRLAHELQLDTLYAIDAETMASDIEKRDSAYAAALWKDYDFKSDDPYTQYTNSWFEAKDQMVHEMTLLEYFKLLNTRESHQANYGAYLVGDFKLDHERGADVLSFWWYNRNARIFRKLQTVVEGPEDRVLLVFGNGHAAVLRQLIECSPELEFVEFDGL